MHEQEDFVLKRKKKKKSFFFLVVVDEEIVYLFDRGNNSFEEIAIYLEIYIITIMVYVMYFLIEFSSIANTNNSSEKRKKKHRHLLRIFFFFHHHHHLARFNSLLFSPTQSFVHSRLNRKHDMSLIEH